MTNSSNFTRTCRRTAALVAVVVSMAACGTSSDSTADSSPPTDDPSVSVDESDVTQTDPTSTVEAQSDSPAAENTDTEPVSEPSEQDTTAALDADESEAPPLDPDDPDPFPDADDPFPDEEPGPDPDPEPEEPVDDTFVPAAADAAFCAANAAFEEADQPEDETEMALVAQGFIAELIAIAPDDIRGDLQVFEEFVARVVSGEADLDGAEDEPAVERAGERISEFIETRCEGDNPDPGLTADPEPDQPDDVDLPADPEFPEGVTIPEVPIIGEIRDDPRPYFGESNDDGGPAAPTPGFVRDELDADFCNGIDVINRRPQPLDDFEEIVVGQQYLEAIAPLVPADLSPSYAILLAWLDVLVDNGSIDGIDPPEPGSEIDEALVAIDGVVNERCLGL